MWEKYDLKKWRKIHSAPNPRSFAFMLAVVSFYLGLVTFGPNFFLLDLAFLFFAFGLVQPKFFKYPCQRWQDLGFLMGWLLTPLILTVVYFLVFTPMALFMKLCGHRALPQRGWVKKVRQCRFERIF